MFFALAVVYGHRSVHGISIATVKTKQKEEKMGFDLSNIANAAERATIQLHAVANNLANTATHGFKSEQVFFHTMKEAMQSAQVGERLTSKVVVYPLQPKKVVNWAQGGMTKTGNLLDMAIEGEGFFSIQHASGTSYSRNGTFRLNKNSELVTSSGAIVLGEGGPIKITGKTVEVGPDGTIRTDGNVVAGKLRITAFKNPQELIRSGDGQFLDSGNARPEKAEKFQVLGQTLETSNVNPVIEMIRLLDIQRYQMETHQKIMQTMSDMDKISTSRLGRLA